MAEYIESKEEHESLVQLGFEYAQGFHYGRPIDIETVSTPAKEYRTENFAIKEKLASAPKKLETGESKQRPLEKLKKLEKLKTASDAKPDKATADASDSIEFPEGYRDSAWIMQQPENHYTIQLTASPSQLYAEQFIAKQRLSGEYAIFTKRGKNSDLFVVLYGTFKDRAEAQLKAVSFRSLRIFALVRRFSAVQSEVRKNKAKNPNLLSDLSRF